jgi:hypothetical protein
MIEEPKGPSRTARYVLKLLGRLTLEKAGRGGESCLCNTVNISLSGVLVETSSIIPVGSLLRYSFRIPVTDTSVDVTGEVVRGEGQRSQAKGPATGGREAALAGLNRYGIRFLDLRDEDRRAIEGFFARVKGG